MLIDDIKKIIESMDNNATDCRLDYRYNEASILESYSTKLEFLLEKHLNHIGYEE